VYSKAEVNDKIEASEKLRDVQYRDLKDDLIYIRGRVDKLAEEVTPDG
jgi:hypothetical protein